MVVGFRQHIGDRSIGRVVVLVFALVLAGCGRMGYGPDGGPDSDGTDGGDSKATWVKPGGYASVTFFVDDTANQTYAGGEIQWMGTFIHYPVTNIVDHDPNWGGELHAYPPLYDDGPISEGGREMPGATAGDHIFSTEVYVLADEHGDTRFQYGAINEGRWIWEGENGEFVLPAGSTDRIDADGFFIDAFGTYDLKVVLDVGQLSETLWPFDPASNSVFIKGSMNSWTRQELADDGDFEINGDELAGDGLYTFLHSANLGPHDGLLNGEQRVQFVLLIDEKEYRAGEMLPDGIAAWTNCSGEFEPVPIFMEPDFREQQLDPTVVICEGGGRLPISAVVPPGGPVAGGSRVTVYGADFHPDVEVTFGAQPADQVDWVGPGQINCLVASHEPGPVAVRVTNPDGEYGELIDGYTYTDGLGPEVRFVEPALGATSGGTRVTLSGVRFAQGAGVTFGGTPAVEVEVLGPRRLACFSPEHAAGTVGVGVSNPDGGVDTLQQAFEYGDEADVTPDWVVLQGPAAMMFYLGETSPPVTGRVYEPALTHFPGCHQDIRAQLGWGPPGSDPLVQPDAWTWVEATCHGDCAHCGGADEYLAWIGVAEPGRYDYAFRFTRDQGAHWEYADRGEGSRDGYQPQEAGSLMVLGTGAGPVVRGIEPAAGSLLGGTPLVVEGAGFVAGAQVLLGGEELLTDFVDPEHLQAETVAHPPGPADLVVILPEPEYARIELEQAYTFVLRGTPAIDGAIENGPESEWPEPYLAAVDERASDWGGNYLSSLYASFDDDNLYLALTAWVDPSAGNAVVIYIDTDYGTGSGVTDTNQLVDDQGFRDQPGLDDAISSRLKVLAPGFGAEFAVGTQGMDDVDMQDTEPQFLVFAGLRSLDDTAEFTWLPASVKTSVPEPSQGSIEIAIPWDSLFENGLRPGGARLAVFARLVSRDGEHLANATLPPDDPDAPDQVNAVFVLDVR